MILCKYSKKVVTYHLLMEIIFKIADEYIFRTLLMHFTGKLKETNFSRSEEYDYFRLVVLGIVNDGRRREDPAGKAEEAADKQIRAQEPQVSGRLHDRARSHDHDGR